MYEELIETLRRCAEGFKCRGCKYEHENGCRSKLNTEAADAIAELNRLRVAAEENRMHWQDMAVKFECDLHDAEGKIPKWVSVNERLPEEYVNVLCHLRSLDRQSEYYSIDHLMEDGQWWKAANSWRHEVELWGDEIHDPFEWVSILGEEYGELCLAVNETYLLGQRYPERGGVGNIIKEATHVTAVALAIIEAFGKEATE